MNPNLADYRPVYSQTNLALAQAILSVEEGTEPDDTEKEQASTLIQQAVREAHVSSNFRWKYSAYWSNLGSVYKA
jgi:hypothetical protein